MAVLDYGDGLPHWRLDAVGGEQEMNVQVPVHQVALGRPNLLGASPVRPETEMDHPGAAPLPLEPPRRHVRDGRWTGDLGIRADRHLPEPEQTRPREARVL